MKKAKKAKRGPLMNTSGQREQFYRVLDEHYLTVLQGFDRLRTTLHMPGPFGHASWVASGREGFAETLKILTDATMRVGLLSGYSVFATDDEWRALVAVMEPFAAALDDIAADIARLSAIRSDSETLRGLRLAFEQEGIKNAMNPSRPHIALVQ